MVVRCLPLQLRVPQLVRYAVRAHALDAAVSVSGHSPGSVRHLRAQPLDFRLHFRRDGVHDGSHKASTSAATSSCVFFGAYVALLLVGTTRGLLDLHLLATRS